MCGMASSMPSVGVVGCAVAARARCKLIRAIGKHHAMAVAVAVVVAASVVAVLAAVCTVVVVVAVRGGASCSRARMPSGCRRGRCVARGSHTKIIVVISKNDSID